MTRLIDADALLRELQAQGGEVFLADADGVPRAIILTHVQLEHYIAGTVAGVSGRGVPEHFNPVKKNLTRGERKQKARQRERAEKAQVASERHQRHRQHEANRQAKLRRKMKPGYLVTATPTTGALSANYRFR